MIQHDEVAFRVLCHSENLTKVHIGGILEIAGHRHKRDDRRITIVWFLGDARGGRDSDRGND